MIYPLPDPDTPSGELYLDAWGWALQFEKCWAHNRPARECEAFREELTSDEMAEGVEYARRYFRR